MTVHVEETVWIEMPDGVRLAARLWRPEGAAEAPVPAVLEYIPYRRRDRTRLRDESIHPHIAAAGYACLRVDLRGSGDSGGVMRDEYAEAEQRDGCDVIAWIAAQPWCDGQVAMLGKSWGAYNALQIAARRPPALRAILPVMGTDDRWREDIHFYGGCLAGDNFWWGCIMQLLNALPPDPAIAGEGWRAMWAERLEAMTFWPADWAAHQTHDAAWRHGSVCEDYAAIEVPIYLFGGWADLYRDTPFRLAAALPGQVKLCVGPWAHLYPHEAVPGPRADFVGEAIRFLDHHLKGAPAPDEPPLRFWIDDAHPPGSYADRAGRWVEEPRWPSPAVADRALHLNAATLAEAPEDGSAMTVRSPQDHGTAGGDMMGFGTPGDLPGDGRIDAGGALLFRSEALTEDADILGQPALTLHAAADAEWGLVAALLYDEAPSGAQTLISRGFANLNHVGGDEDPRPLAPGAPFEVEVPLHGRGYRVPAGHRLCLHLATAYWPILWPAPAPVTLTVPPGRSVLRLPVRRPTPGAPAPRDLTPPERAGPGGATRTREGAMTRTVTRDLETGVVESRVAFDGGVFGPVGAMRLDATGTEMGEVSDRRHSIHPDDPLSARASMTQTATLDRGGWHVRIEATAGMTATADAFRFRAATVAYDGEAEVHRAEWDVTVPRRGM